MICAFSISSCRPDVEGLKFCSAVGVVTSSHLAAERDVDAELSRTWATLIEILGLVVCFLPEAYPCETCPGPFRCVPIRASTTPEDAVRLSGPVHIFSVVVAASFIKVPRTGHQDVGEPCDTTLTEHRGELACSEHG